MPGLLKRPPEGLRGSMSASWVANTEIPNPPCPYNSVLIRNFRSSCLKGRTLVPLVASSPFGKASLSIRSRTAELLFFFNNNNNKIRKRKQPFKTQESEWDRTPTARVPLRSAEQRLPPSMSPACKRGTGRGRRQRAGHRIAGALRSSPPCKLIPHAAVRHPDSFSERKKRVGAGEGASVVIETIAMYAALVGVGGRLAVAAWLVPEGREENSRRRHGRQTDEQTIRFEGAVACLPGREGSLRDHPGCGSPLRETPC